MEFDYVIVGGGSAGSVMAARLSEDPKTTVCLLEAGGDGKGILVRMPLGTVAMLPGYGRINNWAYTSVPQPGLNGRRSYQPRGRALGGSSAINAMLYVRGQPGDYDTWVEMGADGWAWDDVLPYFLKSEGNKAVEGPLHSADGPLQVNAQRAPRPITERFVQAAETLQIRRNDDFNGDVQEGVGHYHVTQFGDGPRNGERCSAAAAYLHPVMGRKNLHVVTGAHAERVLLEDRVARGVRYRKGRRSQEVRARREVILCGGALNSPQLLMLSGIGPAAQLQAMGLDVVRDVPGVGQNLHDHLDYILAYKSSDTDVLGLGLAGTIGLTKALWRWRKDGVSFGASPGAEGGAFLKTDPNLSAPDMQLHFVAGIVDDHVRKLHLGYGFTCHVCQLQPNSRGTVGVLSRDPLAPPRIDPCFLSDERDLEVLLRAVKLTKRIMQAQPLAEITLRELYAAETDDEIRDMIRNRADTIYHPVGTVRMGGVDAPLDPQCRVRGIEGLRVVDASVMPRITSGNTNAPTIMIAEKIAAEVAST